MAEVACKYKTKNSHNNHMSTVIEMEKMGDLEWILMRSFDCSKHTTSEAVIC
jgi:hypothetical protein